jgi:hypothetical protein
MTRGEIIVFRRSQHIYLFFLRCPVVINASLRR